MEELRAAFIENLHCSMIKPSHQLKQGDDTCKTG